ncbi:type VI secretion system contractile sheath large subunit [Pendulispora albinea]|uniref:Type VI secretion system contractile sheath large subunit n=1 Tax=Pendulispora albinea TaxID=2741071 RepID=A0ABZ2LPC9_9BACT
MTSPDTVRTSLSEEPPVDPWAKLLSSTSRIDRLIAKIDALLAEQVDAILHHPAFQSLEAAWRGLKFVIDRTDFAENIQVHLWSCSKEELRADLEESTDRTKSRFFRAVYTEEYGQHGGTPYAAIFADFSLASSPDDPAILVRDVALLRGMASVGAMAHAPVFLGAAPELFGVMCFDELAAMTDLPVIFEASKFHGWNAFRDTEDARYIGLLLPRMLLRLPYRDAEEAAAFVYDERVEHPSDHLWGSAIYAFAVRLAKSHARVRTAMALVGAAGDEPPVRDWHPAMNADACKPPVDIVLSPRLEASLSALGFIPLTCDAVDATLRFQTASSLQRPKAFSEEQATLDYFLGGQIPYLLFVSRFAHFIKVMAREQLGGHHTPEELQSTMTNWLHRYVNRADNPSMEMRFRYPLRGALVEVAEVEGQAGWFATNLFIVPHMRFKAAEFELSVSGRIERR